VDSSIGHTVECLWNASAPLECALVLNAQYKYKFLL